MKSVLRGLMSLAAAGLMVTAASAEDSLDYGFVLHVTEASLQACAQVMDADVDVCDDIVAIGDDAGRPNGQYVWVLVYGFDQIPEWDLDYGYGGVAFGIEYDATVTVNSWSLCNGGLEIPMNDGPGQSPDWPESGSGNAIAWGQDVQAAGGYFSPDSDGKFAKLGYFFVAPGSTGRMWLTVDPRPEIGEAQITSADPITYVVPAAGLSAADVGGTSPGSANRACAKDVPVLEVTWGQIKAYY